jgi:pyruvate/2-oxoglutarate dehydrogenase complex dihydrolipoamide acyltransferase (E2) component
MSKEIKIPRQGQTMTEASIEKWLKNEGDFVNQGEEVAEIMTDKVSITIESPASGTLKIKEPEGETIPVHGVIGCIE